MWKSKSAKFTTCSLLHPLSSHFSWMLVIRSHHLPLRCAGKRSQHHHLLLLFPHMFSPSLEAVLHLHYPHTTLIALSLVSSQLRAPKSRTMSPGPLPFLLAVSSFICSPCLCHVLWGSHSMCEEVNRFPQELITCRGKQRKHLSHHTVCPLPPSTKASQTPGGMKPT